MSDLPGILREVEALIGRDAALHLALRLGGRTVYVPTPDRLAADHRLVAALGDSASAVFAARYAGETLYIPLARGALLVHLVRSGLSISAAAEQLGVSDRTVRRHLAKS